MHDIQLAQDGRRVGRQNHLLEVVDDDLVAAIWTQGRLDGLRDGAAGFDVADHGAVFGIETLLGC